jgi:hypothetical protein
MIRYYADVSASWSVLSVRNASTDIVVKGPSCCLVPLDAGVVVQVLLYYCGERDQISLRKSLFVDYGCAVRWRHESLQGSVSGCNREEGYVS